MGSERIAQSDWGPFDSEDPSAQTIEQRLVTVKVLFRYKTLTVQETASTLCDAKTQNCC